MSKTTTIKLALTRNQAIIIKRALGIALEDGSLDEDEEAAHELVKHLEEVIHG
jgi:hypothetical protein